MTLADIWAGIQAAWAAIDKIIDFGAIWDYIVAGITKVVAMF